MIKIFAGEGIEIQNAYSEGNASGHLIYDAEYDMYKVVDSSGYSIEVKPKELFVHIKPELMQVIMWAKDKMKDEEDLNKLCDEYPELKKQRDIFELMKRLYK